MMSPHWNIPYGVSHNVLHAVIYVKYWHVTSLPGLHNNINSIWPCRDLNRIQWLRQLDTTSLAIPSSLLVLKLVISNCLNYVCVSVIKCQSYYYYIISSHYHYYFGHLYQYNKTFLKTLYLQTCCSCSPWNKLMSGYTHTQFSVFSRLLDCERRHWSDSHHFMDYRIDVVQLFTALCGHWIISTFRRNIKRYIWFSKNSNTCDGLIVKCSEQRP